MPKELMLGLTAELMVRRLKDTSLDTKKIPTKMKKINQNEKTR
jgi:hypothetical protein